MIRFQTLFTIILISCSLMMADAQSILPTTYFEDVAVANGIVDTYGVGHFGGGVSFVDFNEDGWSDLTFGTQAGDSILFYLNNTNVNGQFEKISLVNNEEEVKQVLWVDYDNDNDLDLFISAYLGVNRLYQNDGSLNFTDVTELVGLPLWSDPTHAVCFGDIDNDGFLDLYVANYFSLDGHTNYLFHNLGDGTFEDITSSADVSGEINPSLAVSFIDYNNDGLQDIYVASDKYQFPNLLFRNLGNNEFKEVGEDTGTDISIDAMNIAWADFDQDGDFDLYLTNTPIYESSEGPLLYGNVLLVNDGNGIFEDLAEEHGVLGGNVSWAANFFDMENDADLDLYVTHNRNTAADHNLLFENDGTGYFTEPLSEGITGDSLHSYSSATADFDHDGLLDIAINNAETSNFQLLRNTQTGGNFLKLNLTGTISNSFGIGSYIEVFSNEKKQIAYKFCGTGYKTQNSNTLHFGLDNATVADSIKVKWLSGVTNVLYDVDPNQTVTIIEGGVNSYYETFVAEEMCMGESIMIGENEYNAQGEYVVSLASETGIDSLIYLSLTVNQTYENAISATICDNESYIIGSQSFTTSGTHEVILNTEKGCDSLLILDLVVNNSYEEHLFEEICAGDFHEFNGEIYSETGQYQEIFSSVNGCDSLVNLNLIVLENTSSELEAAICEGEIYEFNGQTYSQTGVFSSTLTSFNGCDSLVELHLQVLENSSTDVIEQICAGSSIEVAGQLFDSIGYYTILTPAFNGCDSILNLQLTFHDSQDTLIYAEICEGESYSIDALTYSETGEYSETFQNQNGCDSTVTLLLDVHQNYEVFMDLTLNIGDYFEDVFIESDTVIFQELYSVHGCDSLVQLNILAELSGIQPIINNAEQITVFPNPVKNKITIENKNASQAFEKITIYDQQGHLITEFNNLNSNKHFVQISTWQAGIYFIVAQTKHTSFTKKLVKL